MRSIFARVLLWFVVSLVVTLAAFAATSFLLSAGHRGGFDFVGRTIALMAEDARRAYEEGGPERLAERIARYDAAYPARHVFTDAKGRDLADGSDRSAMLTDATARPWRPRRVGAVVPVVHPTEDGKYRLISVVRREFNPWTFLPYYLCLLPFVVALCYLMAVHLAAPLRRLRVAVERFGQGDLSARIRSNRADEIGDLAREFDRMAGRIETLLTAERRLLQDVSHELRSPLTRLGFALELARSGPDPSAALARARREADRLAALVDELLKLTRAEGDPSEQDMSTVSLPDLLSDLASDAAVEAEPRGCRVVLDVTCTVSVKGDRELLRRAVENVVRNAVRHAPAGTEVVLRLTARDGEAVITVRDHGRGVPDDLLDAIFRPFFRVDGDRSRDSGGIGLGLAIARRSVLIHKGRLSAVNARPGLLVTIALPDARSDAPEPADSEAPAAVA